MKLLDRHLRNPDSMCLKISSTTVCCTTMSRVRFLDRGFRTCFCELHLCYMYVYWNYAQGCEVIVENCCDTP